LVRPEEQELKLAREQDQQGDAALEDRLEQVAARKQTVAAQMLHCRSG
jgi:hypothetical protein